jgi:hypothetical protein
VRRFLFLLVSLGCAAAVSSCQPASEPFARALRIESLDQAIGGPTANARVGDFLLENDQIRAVVEQGGRSKLPLDVGGSLIDLDLVRPEERFRGGKGLDQLGQIVPVANLYLGRALGDRSARITSPDGVAEITVSAEAAPVQKILAALGLLLRRDFAGNVDHSKFRLYSEYRLHPGERVVRVRTTVGFDVPFCRAEEKDGCNAACDDILYDADCVCPRVPDRCMAGVRVQQATSLPDRPEPMGIADILLGDLPRPVGTGACQTHADCNELAGETCTDITTTLGGTSRVCRSPAARDPGVFLGDMLIFGGNLSPFVSGTGFDTETDIRRLFDSGVDTLSTPLSLDAVYAVGDRVSYGYAPPEGRVLIPVFGGPFSMGVTAAASCRHDQPGCLAGTLLRAERWVSVGEGDAASAAEALHRARGAPLGEVVGGTLWEQAATPAPGAEVLAFTDPRSLPCGEACLQRCANLSETSDAEVSGWTLEALLEHNRCRTRTPTHLEGAAGVVTQALADLGTDPVKDGRFRLALPPGRYILMAQVERRARSALSAVTVRTGKTNSVNLLLPEPGRLAWALTDHTGRPVAGRVLVGRCLPGAPCAGDDDCTGGDRCQAGACGCTREVPWPLEVGGGRLGDGVHAFDLSRHGQGEILLPPGEYDVVFSRGPHHTVDRARVTVHPNASTRVQGAVLRAIDRTGWTAADFHVHAEESLDSGTAMTTRVDSFLAEDLDFLSSSDHDVLSNYGPLIRKMGVADQLASQVGVEVTTQELGHFIGYPMRWRLFDDTPDRNRVPGNGAPEWRELGPKELFAAMREAGPEHGRMVVSVPHPYGYFDTYGLHPVTLEPQESIVALFNPLLKAERFGGGFEAMELMNAKAFDLIRRPTVDEIRFFSREMDALLVDRREGRLDEQGYFRAVYELSTETTRRILHRTPEEQQAALQGRGAELDCRCGSDGDCSSGLVCDPATLSCVATPGAGAPAEGTGMCRALRGVVDDWFTMLNRGLRRTGVGGSDVHGLYGYEPGVPRTLVHTGATMPPNVTEEEIVQGVLGGKVVVTNGPLLSLEVNGAGVGEVVAGVAGQPVRIRVGVQSAGWYDVDRVELYRNGELIHWVSGCDSRRPGEIADPHGHPCLPAGVHQVLDETFEDHPGGDAWYVAIASGLDGRTLGPIYSSALLPRLGTFEITQRIYDIVPALRGLRVPRFPSLYPTFPFAITNPVWVDQDGDGWTPPLPPPSWCTPDRDFACNRR